MIIQLFNLVNRTSVLGFFLLIKIGVNIFSQSVFKLNSSKNCQSYIILSFLLQDLKNRSEAKLKQISADPRKCIATLFEFIPMSGKTSNNLDEIETSKYGIENFGSVKEIESKVSGVQRNFDVNMYGIYKVHVLMCFLFCFVVVFLFCFGVFFG